MISINLEMSVLPRVTEINRHYIRFVQEVTNSAKRYSHPRPSNVNTHMHQQLKKKKDYYYMLTVGTLVSIFPPNLKMLMNIFPFS